MYTKGGFDLDKLKRKLTLKKEDGDFGFSLVCNSKRLGNYIKDVVPGSVAERAGIKPGDRVIQIGTINIIGFQPIEIVKLLSIYENLLELYVVEEKFYKVYLKQNEYPQISSPAYDEKNIDGSVFVRSSDEQVSTTSSANRARMYDFETGAATVVQPLTGDGSHPSMASPPTTTNNDATYRTLNTASSRSVHRKKDILFSAWNQLKSCFKGTKIKRHKDDYSHSEPPYNRNYATNINFPTPKDEAVMTNTNVASSSSNLSNQYGISNVRTKSGNATKSSKVPTTTKSATKSATRSDKIITNLESLSTQIGMSSDEVCRHNKQLAQKSYGRTNQQNEKYGTIPHAMRKISLPLSSGVSKSGNTTKSSPRDSHPSQKRNEVVIQFEHPKIILLNSTERDIEV